MINLRICLSLIPLAAASGALAQYAGAEPVPEAYKPGFEAIRRYEAKEWLDYLAGPETEGRGTGQPGYIKAANFMAARFREMGLKPVGDKGTFFQNIPFQRSRIAPGSLTLRLPGSGLEIGGLSVGALAESIDIIAPVVFVRSDSTEAVLPPDAPLKGKIVILSGGGADRLRVLASRGSVGAAAVLTVGEVRPYGAWSTRRGSANSTRRTPTGVISAEAAELVAETLEAGRFLTTATNGSGAPQVEIGQGLARLSATVQKEEVMVPNVVALFEGSDAKLKEEMIGVGAHLDHLGVSNGVVHPGADDDASGNTALLAIARALSTNPVKPKRSVLFMAFCGEEMGLIGSRHYAENPIFPLANMICELQMDMVGRNEQRPTEKPEENVNTIHLVGSKRLSTELHEAVLAANKHVNFAFEYDEEDVYTRSDHYSFAAKGVPIAFLFSGFHPDYHRPSDTPDKINFEKITNAAKLFYLTIQDLANRPERPKKDAQGG